MLIQGWVKADRVISILKKGSTHALVIFTTTRTPIQANGDIDIEQILPIDQDFQCDIGTEEKLQDVSDVYLNVTYKKAKKVFEMKPGNSTTSLVSGIFQAIECKLDYMIIC